MSKIGLVVLLSLLTGRTVAQNYFVIIGSDNSQPFYVRLDSQFYSSSPEGHLLLAPLKDSDYTLTVGFPGQLYPEKRYAFSIRHKDQEFQLKKQDDGGWRLYDVQTKVWMTAQDIEGEGGDTRTAGIKKDDAFSRMMAAVVHDTAVLYNTFAMQQALDDSAAAAKNRLALDSSTVSDTSQGVTNTKSAAESPVSAASAKTSPSPPKTSPGQPETSPSPPKTYPAPDSSGASARPAAGVVKLSEKKSPRSLRQVYTDAGAGGQTDTIVVIIPVDTVTKDRHSTDTVTKAQRPAIASNTSPAVTTSLAVTAATDTVIKDRHLAGSPVTATPSRPANAVPYINSDCHNFATDYDIDKLRIKMLDAPKDEDRIAAARKVFKTKCFYTSQISALSEVFTTDASKFRFFEAAWPYAADEHFHELSLLLRDPVYIGKFKTMTGTQP